jgi:hypothetical protein
VPVLDAAEEAVLSEENNDEDEHEEVLGHIEAFEATQLLSSSLPSFSHQSIPQSTSINKQSVLQSLSTSIKKQSVLQSSSTSINKQSVLQSSSTSINKQSESTAKASGKSTPTLTADITSPAPDITSPIADIDMSAWSQFQLYPLLLKGLQSLSFAQPTEIQSRVLPIACQPGRDIIGTAETVSHAYSINA